MQHEIVTVVGRTGSGKTRLIARYIGARHERRITLDYLGECRTLYPHAIRAQSVAQVVNLMHALDERNATQWHIVAEIDPDATGLLVRLLAPVGNESAHSLAAAWGGLALEIFELDLVAPVDRSNKSTREAMRTAYARGRHYGLSVIAATQRPHQIDRIATAQSTYVASFAMHEPADIRFLERVGGEVFAATARSGLREYESVWLDTRSGRMWVLGKDYRTVRTLDPGGVAR